MAGILVEYSRFVEVQQRRARVVEELRQPPAETPADTSMPAAVDDQLLEVGESRRQFRSIQNDAAQQRIRNDERRREHDARSH